MAESFPKPDIPQEARERKEQQARLESLEGYQALSEKQQQMIRVSLALQQRAERGSDAASARQIERLNGEVVITRRPDEPYDHTWIDDLGKKLPRTYSNSQNRIDDWYCCAAVEAIEHAQDFSLTSGSFDYSDSEFFEGIEYHQNIASSDDLEAFIALEIDQRSLPLVLDIGNDYFPSGVHSALVLGKDSETGEVTAWEKEAVGRPFRLVTLAEIFERYGPGFHWGVRPLRDVVKD